jgi:ubiquinol-cytochrome c reductase cytochrome c subunit
MSSMLRRRLTITIAFGITAIISLYQFDLASAQDCKDPEVLEHGASLYFENCAVCHGENGQGRVGTTLAKDWPSIRPDLRVRETITTGGPGELMPAWGQENGGPLGEDEIDALTCYILSWQTGGPPVIPPTRTPGARLTLTPPPGVTGDPNNGALLYGSNCAVCHGTEGEGRIGANLAKVWPSIRPDLQIKSVIESGVEDSPMPAWSQEYGGPLSTGEIDDLVAYILTWSGAVTSPEEVEPTQGPITGWLAWVIIIGVFVLIVVAIVYYSRQTQGED